MMQALSVHIRGIHHDEWEALAAIEQKSFDWPWDERDLRKVLHARNVWCQVAEVSDGQIAGFIVYALARSQLELWNLAVLPQWRRVGIGRRLIARLVEKLRPGRERLVADVREKNTGAQLFFRACGFRAVQVIRRPYAEIDEDAYRFVYELPAAVPANRVARFF